MSVRCREMWRTRKARKARRNEKLVRADQMTPSQLDARERELWADEARASRLWEQMTEPGEWEAS